MIALRLVIKPPKVCKGVLTLSIVKRMFSGICVRAMAPCIARKIGGLLTYLEGLMCAGRFTVEKERMCSIITF
jgi:hypothetical protein